jgi:cell division septation protein DedD
MDRKVKHRILGFFVVVAVIVILLPFFQSGKDVKSQATLIKAPPFPDQTQQISTPAPNTTVDEAADSVEQATTPAVDPATAAPTPTKPTDTNNRSDNHTTNTEPMIPAPQAADNAIQLQSDDVITNTIQPVSSTDDSATSDTSSQADIDGMQAQTAKVSMEAPSLAPTSHEITQNTVLANHSQKKSKHPMATSKIKNAVHRTNTPAASTHTKMHSAANSISSFTNEDLFKEKNPVWVIQLGSFKNKTNALRLVNQLRANGYRAFIQQVNSTEGNSTRVYVGPETKQTAARALAGELESQLHVRGIVISYQPLAL